MTRRFCVYGLLILLLAVVVLAAHADTSVALGDVALPSAISPSSPDFTLEAQPVTRTVTQGQTAVYTTTVTAQDGFSETVHLTVGGTPVNTTADFATSPITPTGESTLVVTTTASTPFGGHTLTITGTSPSVIHSTQVTLYVLNPAPDFALIVTPEADSAFTGEHATYTVTVVASNSFSQPVNLSVSGLPSGAGGTFSANPVTPTSQSALTVTTATTTPPGDYTLTITGTSGALSHGASVTLTVKAPLITYLPLVLRNQTFLQAAFTFAPTDVIVGEPVNFTDQSIGNPTAWEWDFGDGSPHATVQHPTHTYTAVGTFTVTLTVSNSLYTDVATGVLTARAIPPTASFTRSPADTVPVGTVVYFTSTSTGSPPLLLDWDFGDGSPHATVQNPTHVYTETGVFTVTLAVSNAGGSDVATDLVEVVVPGTELLTNGGFETDAAWEFTNTPVPGEYTDAAAHSGQRSVRLGIVPPAADRYSYSSVLQRVTIPADAGHVTLSFWYWPQREGGSTTSQSRALAQDAVGQSLTEWQTTLTQDTQYAIVLDPYKNILHVLMAVSEHASGWKWATFDLTAYKGRTIYIYFDAYNNGSAWEGRRTWMYVDNVSLMATEAAPTGIHWIDVDLSDQMLYAYEGNTAVRSTLVSTGVPAYPTPTGQFYIYAKYLYDDMSGPGYYLPDVPYTMYFYLGYAIHGTYWHNNFGHPMSHGCINLPTPEAEWLYNWASIGTLVNIHD